MKTNTGKVKVYSLGEVDRDALRLLATEVDENGSATYSQILAGADLRMSAKRWARLAQKGLVTLDEERDRIQFTGEGWAFAEAATRAAAQAAEARRISEEAVRLGQTLRHAVDAGNATAAECVARALPLPRER
jgi:hypothetical protein